MDTSGNTQKNLLPGQPGGKEVLRVGQPGKVVIAIVRGKDPLLDALASRVDALASSLAGERAARQKAEGACADEMTARRRTQDRLEQALALLEDRELLLEQERALPARLSLLMTWILHGLRTPLTCTTGFAELLADTMAGQQKNDGAPLPDATVLLSRVQSGNARMLEALDIARDFLLVESGKFKVRLENLDLGNEAARVAGIMQPRAAENKLVLEACRCDRVHANGDARLLAHALASIIRTSIKCSKAGGHITLSAEKQRNLAVISVSDTGSPITPEERAFVLDSKDRGEHLGTVEGRGPGLAVAREFVEHMGGVISVESDGKKGTTVTIALPAP